MSDEKIKQSSLFGKFGPTSKFTATAEPGGRGKAVKIDVPEFWITRKLLVTRLALELNSFAYIDGQHTAQERRVVLEAYGNGVDNEAAGWVTECVSRKRGAALDRLLEPSIEFAGRHLREGVHYSTLVSPDLPADVFDLLNARLMGVA